MGWAAFTALYLFVAFGYCCSMYPEIKAQGLSRPAERATAASLAWPVIHWELVKSIRR